MVRRKFRRNEIVFHEGDLGDRLYLVAKGFLLARVITIDGDESALSVMGPGDVIGEIILLEGQDRRSATIVALEPSELLSLSADEVAEVREKHAAVDRALTAVVADRIRSLLELLEEARYVPADKRVLRRLLDLAQLVGGEGAEAPIDIRFTQEDLAAMAGTTRPTANRALQKAVENDMVELGRRRITVLDPDGLDRLAH